MKKLLLSFAICFYCCAVAHAGYSDHRGHNLDSLERVVSSWTIDREDAASEGEISDLAACYDKLMNGYKQINGPRSIYYARRLLRIADAHSLQNSRWSASKVLGEIMWAQEKYDSAAFWYKNGLDAINRMVGSYPEVDVDNGLSAVYGSLGNLYCVQDSIPQALYYYGKAGEIFEKYNWIQSLAVLNSNMGELYLWQEDYKSAESHYRKALDYGREANDSLLIANPLKGLGNMYLQQGKTAKAMESLVEADKYYLEHKDQEFMSKIEVMEMMSKVYISQKRHLTTLTVILMIAIVLMLICDAAAIVIHRMRKQKKETEAVLLETIDELPKARLDDSIRLNDREVQILKLIEADKTSRQIADQIFLSTDTIKWYRHKLLVKFDAVNTAELLSKAHPYLFPKES